MKTIQDTYVGRCHCFRQHGLYGCSEPSHQELAEAARKFNVETCEIVGTPEWKVKLTAFREKFAAVYEAANVARNQA